MPVVIAPDSYDVDALARLVQAEAANIESDYESVFAGQPDATDKAMALAYGSIIDSVLNRVAADSPEYGTTIQDVIDKNNGLGTYQYSSLPANSATTWSELPSADSSVTDFVDSWLTLRAIGQGSIVGSATHYYDPNISSPSWGSDLQRTTDVSADGSDHEHLFGLLPDTDAVPQNYTIDYNGDSTTFIGVPPIPAEKPDPLIDTPLNPIDLEPLILPDNILPARDKFGDAEQQESPLVIDLSSGHTGVTLTEFDSATTTTFFDLTGDGFATQTAWVSGDTGLLARDLNSNGKIDSVSELFGSPTVDGFAQLAALDSNHDGKIDHNDTDWSTLVVWSDTNGDAVTQDGELHSLDSLGITSIDLAHVAASNDTIDGNTISHTSTVTFSDSSTAAIDDAWFTTDPVNSFYNGDYTLDADTLFLPDLRGYGTLPDLAIAMSNDGDLKTLVSDFASSFSFASFADPSTLDSDISNILYKWAGVDGVATDARGNYVDAQHLDFLEDLFGQAFVQNGWVDANPWSQAGTLLESSYSDIFHAFKADILLQTGGQDLFDSPVTYNPWTGTVDGTIHLSETAVSDLASNAPGTDADAQAFWVSVADFIDNTEGITNLDTDEQGWLNTVVGSTTSVTWDEIVNQYHGTIPGVNWSGDSSDNTYTGTANDDTLSGFAGNDELHGGAGNDTIYGGGGDDVIYGDAGNDIIYGDDISGSQGNDTIYGGDGNDIIYANDSIYATDINTIYGGNGDDIIYGGNGDDIIDGGPGGNTIYGGTGDNTYIYGGGDDYIQDSGGTEVIVLPSGVTAEDITFHYTPSPFTPGTAGDLIIDIAGSGTIEIENQFGPYSSANQIETLQFSDSSTIDLTSLSGIDTILTSSNDSFTAWDNSDYTVHGYAGNDYIVTGNGNDTLDGGSGNDTLIGGAGDDTYIAGPGFDTIHEGGGTDTIVVPAGYTMGDVTFTSASSDPSDLLITIRGLGEIQVSDQLYGSTNYVVENLHFLGDDSTVSITDQQVTYLGGSGDDYLSAKPNTPDGNIYDGREGNDTISGGYGDDTYVFSPGHDIVNDTGGNDTILMPNDVSPEDISLARVADGYTAYDLVVTDNVTGDSMTIYNHFYDNTYWDPGNPTPYAVEHIQFSDSTTWDLLTMAIETHGTSGADNLSGATIGTASADDVIYGYGGDDNISGGDGNDTISGGTGNDTLYGNDGNDVLDGGAGDDTLDGGSGTDTVTYFDASAGVTVDLSTTSAQDTVGAGTDTITGVENLTGSAYDDTLTGNSGDNVLIGGAGNDTLDGGAGIDTVDYSAASSGVTVSLLAGTASNDGDGGSDTLLNIENVTGSAFSDTITGDTHSNVLNGLGGNDTILGSTADDTIYGGDGNDLIEGNGGNDVLDGGNGIDTVDYTLASGAVTIDLSAGTVTGADGNDTISNFENANGSAYNDTITGDGNDNVLSGAAGNDTIDGGAGNDTIQGGAGDDNLTGGIGIDTLTYSNATSGVTVDLSVGSAQNTGGAGTDTISGFENLVGSIYNDTLTGDGNDNIILGGAGNDVLHGGDGNDTLRGGPGNDTLYGDAGIDTVDYSAASSGVTVNLLTGTASDGDGGTDTLYNIENVTGSAFGDTITGNTQSNVLNGLGGNDTILGSAADDTIYGGDGNDLIEGNGGNDVLDGGNGIDTVDYTLASGAVTIDLSAGTVTGSDGNDTISNFENANGSAYNDTITGDGNDNVLSGAAGNDTIDGGAGNDTIQGGAGDDNLTGGIGIDTLTYSNATSGVTVDLSVGSAQNTGGAGTDTISGFENLTGSAYNDTLTGDSNANVLHGGAGDDILIGGGGGDTLDGGSGTDTVSYAAASSGVTVDLSAGTVTGYSSDTLSNIENVTGSSHNDTIVSNSADNIIDGGAGTDTVSYASASSGVTVDLSAGTATGDGNDTLSHIENVTGSTHDDTIAGNSGDNTLDGGAGTDTVDYSAASSSVTVDLSAGTATGDGSDTLRNIENVTGSSHDDTITGDSDANVLHGGAGDDTLSGGDGADILYGDSGADTFVFLAASAFNNVDQVQDFNTSSGDKIDISDILSGHYNPGTDDITDFVQIQTSGSDSTVNVDIDGAGSGHGMEQIATIIGVTGLTDVAALIASGNLVV